MVIITKRVRLPCSTEIRSKEGRSIFHITHVEASGDRSVAIGGNANNSTIVTGDENVIGNGNTVQNVTQRG